MGAFVNLRARRFGRLTVTRRGPNIKPYRVRWWVKCDCGKSTLVFSSNLVSGKTRSCGCGVGGKVVHGHCVGKTDAEYKMWTEARKRAREKGISFSIALNDIHIPKYCPVFKFELKRNTASGPSDTSPSLDRLNPKLGYTKRNIWVISVKANRAKNNLSVKEVGMLYRALKKRMKWS